MFSPLRRGRSAPALIVCLILLTGCAGHRSTMEGVRAALLQEDLDAARAVLADAGRGTDDLLFALEDGLLLHVVGDPELSNSRLEFAEQRIDELYTKSISRAALSLISSDLVLKYEPRGIENFLINHYRALNYLQLGAVEEAWVEWRKLAAKLRFSRDQGDAPYLDPPFFDYVAGLGLESDDANEAYISLRLAEAAYRDREQVPPAELIEDLLRLAADLGFGDHLDYYQSEYGEAMRPGTARAGPSESSGGRWGEVVVVIEEGLVAPIEELQVYLPITRERAELVAGGDRGAQLELSQNLAGEFHAGRYKGVDRSYAGRREIAYVLPLAFPVFGRGEAAFESLAATAGADTIPARPLLEVSKLQGAAFQDGLLGIYAKTIARALLKYAVASELRDEAEEEGGDAAGDVVGVVANLVNVLTERADTRAWLGLPHRIWVARLTVSAGIHQLGVLVDDKEKIDFGEIEVLPGERLFVSYRIF
ncbi:MAG: hypothetical protein JSU87_16250 [Gemmatimonadota bacterium]|nr:MAG: hypothetical protein JSU87_16250 [Gemmatimonadota bacterium]